jgi:hypothetical protein
MKLEIEVLDFVALKLSSERQLAAQSSSQNSELLMLDRKAELASLKIQKLMSTQAHA